VNIYENDLYCKRVLRGGPRFSEVGGEGDFDKVSEEK